MLRALGLLSLAAYLTAASAAAPFQPEVVRFDAPVWQIRLMLAGRCNPLTVRTIDPPFLPRIKSKQIQIDCEGFLFFGKPRHAEFVIGDGRLEMVWIMTEPGEDGALRDAMTLAYGSPDYRNAVYDAFAAHRAALRLDKHEVLFYAPDLDADMAPDFAPGAK